LNATPTGEVFDIGYQRYEGPREGRPRARMAIFKEGIRIALGLGRGGKSKILPWIFIGILTVVALIMALIAGTLDRLAGDFAESDLPSHSDFYAFASIVIFLFAASVAPELLCADRRDRVINLFLVRPITGLDYIAARFVAFFAIMAAVALLPQTVLLLGLTLGAESPWDYLKDNWADAPRFIGSGLALAVYTTGLAFAVASFTNRRAYATAFIIGLFLISLPFAEGLAQDIGGTTGQYLALLNLTTPPILINDIVFNLDESTTETMAAELPKAVQIGWYILLTSVLTGLMALKYRRISL
jgi:ABC-2 type transport system permease protein